MKILIFISYLYANDFFTNKTEIKNPFDLRDPFKIPSKQLEKREALKKGIFRGGVFTNIPTIDDISLSEIKIKGVFIGEERRAVAEISGGGTTILTEGMLLGKDNAEIKAILPGGIVLVEKIVNVYGQDEYLETILPISD